MSDLDDFLAAMDGFQWMYTFPVLGLVLLNYVIRSERWHSYLRDVGMGLQRRRSFQIFVAGLSMSVTPAKIGEALKGLLLKMERGSPVERGVGIVVVERISDLLGMSALIAVGAVVFPYGLVSLTIIVAALAFVVAAISSESVSGRVLAWMRRRQKLRRLADLAEAPMRDSRTLLSGRSLLRGSVLSVVAWMCECLAFFLILQGSGANTGIAQSVFIYAFSSVIGAISMLPGGMGTTEATMIGLLLIQGVTPSLASFAVVLTRVCTLWFAVLVGTVALGLFSSSKSVSNVEAIA